MKRRLLRGGGEGEKRWSVFPLTSIFNRLHSLSSRLPPLLPVAALFPQSPIIFSMWSRSRLCTQAHLNMASVGAGNKTIFNRSLHSSTLSLSLSPPPLTTPIFPRHKPRHHANVPDSPVASSFFFHNPPVCLSPSHSGPRRAARSVLETLVISLFFFFFPPLFDCLTRSFLTTSCKPLTFSSSLSAVLPPLFSPPPPARYRCTPLALASLCRASPSLCSPSSIWPLFFSFCTPSPLQPRAAVSPPLLSPPSDALVAP